MSAFCTTEFACRGSLGNELVLNDGAFGIGIVEVSLAMVQNMRGAGGSPVRFNFKSKHDNVRAEVDRFHSRSADQLLRDQTLLRNRLKRLDRVYRLIVMPVGVAGFYGLIYQLIREPSTSTVSWGFSACALISNLCGTMYITVAIRRSLVRLRFTGKILDQIDQDGVINRLLADLNEHIAATPTIFTTNALTHLTVLRLYKLLGELDASGAVGITSASRQAICEIVAGENIASTTNRHVGRRTADTSAVLRAVGIHALGIIGGDDAVNALKKRARITKAARIRRLSLSALERIDAAAAAELKCELHGAEENAASGALLPRNTLPRIFGYGMGKYLGIAILICIVEMVMNGNFPIWLMVAFIALPTTTMIVFGLFNRVNPAVERVQARAIELLNCDDSNILNNPGFGVGSPGFGVGSHLTVPHSVQIGEAIANISADNVPFLLPEYLRRINGILGLCTQYLRRQFTVKSIEHSAENESRDLQSSYRRGILTVARAEVIDGLLWIGDSKTAKLLNEMASVSTDAEFREHCLQVAEAIGVRLASPPGELLRPVRAMPADCGNQLVVPSNAPRNDSATKPNNDHQNELQAFHQHVTASSRDEVHYD